MRYYTTTISADTTTSNLDIARWAIDEALAMGLTPVDAEHPEDRIHPDLPTDGWMNLPQRRGGFARVGVAVVEPDPRTK